MAGERLLSGNEQLDRVLGGGLPANAISLIMGLPGSGKTIVAQQYVFHNGTAQRPAIYFSTVSEPMEKIIRFGQTLDFFDPSRIGISIFYENLGDTLSESGLAGVADRMLAVLKDRRPGLVVIDSFKALQAFSPDPREFRRFLHQLAGRLGAFPTASLWVGEYEEADIAGGPEFAVADAIICLGAERCGERETRLLQVMKLRGGDFLSGRHAYRLARSGLNLFPRLADVPLETTYELGDTRLSSGIAALDEMLADGYWPGASTLVAGPSGSGKTLMGLHFIFNGARLGEPGIIATLQENPIQLRRIAAGFGWSLDEPGVEIMYRSPVSILIDEWVHDLLRTAQRLGARRILIDSLADLRVAATDEIRLREFLYSLVQRCSRAGISLMMTMEIADLFGAQRLSEYGTSHLSDNVVLLRYFMHGGSLKRAMTVIKTRASRHEPQVREFLVQPAGIVLGGVVPLAGDPGMGGGPV